MTNEDFLDAILESFIAYLDKGTSTSTDKIRALHGAIAKDIARRLGTDYDVWSKGYLHDKEALMEGRYLDKRVDITIKKNSRAVAGIAVKFAMQNYSQNSNNYFENMLGETANIRCSGDPYFQVFIILDHLPYYDTAKNIKKWESITDHNIAKYLVLSQDDTTRYMHTPNKTLIFVVHIPDCPPDVRDQKAYLQHYRQNRPTMTLSAHKFGDVGSAVIINDYEQFIEKVYHSILAI